MIKKLLIVSGKARCVARLDAFDKFCDLLPAILTAIETIAKNFDAKYSRSNAEKAKPLFMGTCQFQIIVNVRKKHYYYYCDIAIIEKLQGNDTDLAKVMSDVKLLKKTLKELRAIADMHYAVWFQEF